MNTINFDTFSLLKENMGDIMPELIKVFFEDVNSLLQEIEEGINNDNLEQVSKATHTLKSSAKSMGADKLTNYILTIESSVQNGTEDNLIDVFLKASKEMRNVETTVGKIMS